MPMGAAGGPRRSDEHGRRGGQPAGLGGPTAAARVSSQSGEAAASLGRMASAWRVGQGTSRPPYRTSWRSAAGTLSTVPSLPPDRPEACFWDDPEHDWGPPTRVPLRGCDCGAPADTRQRDRAQYGNVKVSRPGRGAAMEEFPTMLCLAPSPKAFS